MSAPIRDRWREGRASAKRLSPQASGAGGGCFVSMVCVGRGSSWWSGCLASSEPVPQELGGGLCMDVVGQESGQGVSLPPAWTGCALAPPHQGQMLFSFTGCWGWAGALGIGTKLWSRKGLGPEAFGSQRAWRSQAGCLLGQHSSLGVLSGSYQTVSVPLAFLLGPDTFQEWTVLTWG